MPSRFISAILMLAVATGCTAKPVKVCRHEPLDRIIYDGFDATKSQHERVRDAQTRKRLESGKDAKLTPRSRYVCRWVEKQ